MSKVRFTPNRAISYLGAVRYAGETFYVDEEVLKGIEQYGTVEELPIEGETSPEQKSTRRPGRPKKDN